MSYKFWVAVIIIAPIVFIAGLVFGHPGPLDEYGCHTDKALFGNNTKRECHTGLLAGQVFASTTAEYKAMIAALQAELAKCKDACSTPAPSPTPIPAPVPQALTLTWDANREPDLAGYRIYCGTVSKVYPTNQTVPVGTTTATIQPLGAPTYCAVTAFDTSGNESPFSSEVSK